MTRASSVRSPFQECLCTGTGLSVLALLLLTSCTRSDDKPLPPESDLYAYSLAVMEQARLKAPKSEASALMYLGKVHERFGIEDRAIDLYKEALEMDPNLSEAYRSVGFILSQRKDRMAEALEAYQQVLRVAPSAPGILSRMSLLFMHMGRLDDAALCADEEIRGKTQSAETYYFKGQIQALQNQHAAAVDSFLEALRLAPDHRRAQYALAQSFRAMGKIDAAEEAEKRFRELKGREDEQGESGAAPGGSADPASDREEQTLNAARTWIEAAELYAEESHQKEIQPSLLAALQRDYVEALRQAKRLAPRDMVARKLLIQYFQKGNDVVNAAKECSEALAIDPNDAGLATPAFQLGLQMVEALPRNAGPEDPTIQFAHRLLDQVVKAKPDFTEAHRELSRFLLFRVEKSPENLRKAVEHARQAVQLGADPASYDILALAYWRSNRIDLAAATLEEGVRRHPNDPALKKRIDSLRQTTQGN